MTTVTADILRLGFLASHGGSAMRAIVDACREGRLPADPRVVISNNRGSVALERGKEAGLATYLLNGKTHPEPDDLDLAVLETLRSHDVALVVLSGYMKKIGPRTLDAYRNRILNVHPALLPKFGGKGMYGRFVHEAVLAAGECVTGVTIHVVDEEYDHGPVVAQRELRVRDDDTPESLAERVGELEGPFFAETLRAIARGELDLDRVGDA